MSTQPDRPSIAVVGAGAIGGYFGGRLAAAGHDVRFLARGANLAALRRHGLRMTSAGEEFAAAGLRATSDPREIGPVDYVLLCVKTTQLAAASGALFPLLRPGTAVVTVQNGVEAPAQAAERIGRVRVLPGLARVAATVTRPGQIAHAGPPGALAFAEWNGSTSDRVTRLRDVLHQALGTRAEPADIWADLWAKFMLIVPIGSLGAATGGASIGQLRIRAGTRQTVIDGMREIWATGRALGIALPDDAVETAITMMDRQQGDVTTSLQRDILAGRLSELDAWTGAAIRLARQAGQPAPVHQMLYDLLATREALPAAS